MSDSLFEQFKSLFTDLKPKDYHKWQEERDLNKVSAKVETFAKELGEFGSNVVPPLKSVREKVDQLRITVMHMIPRWMETEASKVRTAITALQDEVDSIKLEVKTAEGDLSWEFWRPEEQTRQLKAINDDIGAVEETLVQELDALDQRKEFDQSTPIDQQGIGEGSDFTDHGLRQGWVPNPKGEGTFQYQSKEEWENLQRRGVNQQMQTQKMQSVSKGHNDIFLRDGQDIGLAQDRLKKERETTVQLRLAMTDEYRDRLTVEGPVKDGVVNNIKFAKKLADLLQDPSIEPGELLKKFDLGSGREEAGILNRIIGNIQGQGQFPDQDPTAISEGIGKVSDNLDKGALEDGDANMIQQFISAFVDGLTEVNETNKHAQDQFDLLWEKMQTAFGLKKEDKARLMERVEVYKKLAGGLADTSESGKGTRKGFTRKGNMTLNDNNTIEDPEALIANDISGSMHSQFLAMELAETLSGNAKDELGQPINGFRSAGDSVQVKDKDVLNARMRDALTLTAGGMQDRGGGPKDFVMHTAYEMINGVQAITGVANKVTQKTATAVMELLKDGKSFSDAMEEALPHEVFPWQLADAGTVNKRASDALEAARQLNVSVGDPELDAITKLVEDVLWMATDLDAPSVQDIAAIKEALDKGTTLTAAMSGHFKKAVLPWK